MPVQFLVETMHVSGGDDSKRNVSLDNGGDTEASQTMEPTEMVNCDLIPVLSLIKDLVSQRDQESDIIRSFDIHEGGRNGKHL